MNENKIDEDGTMEDDLVGKTKPTIQGDAFTTHTDDYSSGDRSHSRAGGHSEKKIPKWFKMKK